MTDLSVERDAVTDRVGVVPASSSRPGRSARWVAAVLAVVVLLSGAVVAAALGLAQRDGVPQRNVVVDGVPITMYVPGTVAAGGTVDLTPPAPLGQRPPGLVLAHGHSANRATMSWLAGQLAAAGFVVATFDFRGHGGHRSPQETHGFEGRRADLRTVFEWLSRQPYVDGDRVAIAGHSMGAAAVVDFATHDSRPAATVALGGSVAIVEGDVAPRNLLFLVADGDPDAVRDEAVATARTMYGGEIHFGEQYGTYWDGSAVGLREVAGANHMSMLYAAETAKLMTDWMSQAVGPGTDAVTATDRRIGWALAYLVFLVFGVALLGLAAGVPVRGAVFAAPEPARRSASGSASEVPAAITSGPRSAGWRRLLLLTAALLVPIPWLTWGDAGVLVGLEAGGALVVLLAAAGAVSWVLMSLSPVRRWAGLDGWSAVPSLPGSSGDSRALVAGLLAAAGLVVLLAPLGPVGHGFDTTPTRLLLSLLAMLLLLPYFAAVELLLRRGSPGRAIGFPLAARLTLLVVAFAAVVAGLLPGMIGLYLMVLAPFALLMEICAVALYRMTGDPRATAVFQAAAVGWLLGKLSPVLW
ncbi:serine aminopeptidase domain-containing protein [Micromonospora sp. LOL_021]|uniref:alpha/beta hydrolase family protein n=1 Tax=Micromonospora sp. LOL_021 TaxID=3345417 RepID=UPI003A848560